LVQAQLRGLLTNITFLNLFALQEEGKPMSPRPQNITCEYCATRNLAGGHRCIACGAPLPVEIIQPLHVDEVESTIPAPELSPIPADNQPLSQQLKEGAAVVGSGLGVLGIGGLILRTVAEAVAIAVAAYIIGMFAGSADITMRGPVLYLLIALGGGGLVGLCVGLVTKRTIFTLLSAPFGTILGGYLVPIIFSLNTPRSPWQALFALAGGVLFALLGSRRSTNKIFACYQRARPFLGLIGGLIFGLLGYFVFHRIY
jgi:hypothetical protein